MTIRLPGPRRRRSPATADEETRRSDAPSFAARVIAVVRRIPPGKVSTYGEVADLAGQPRAARAVGNIMRECHRADVPCHRVIAAGGRLGGYGGREALKRSLLAAEGIPAQGRRIPLDRYGWRPRSSTKMTR